MAQSASPLSHREPVSFPEWHDVLRRGPSSAAVQAAYAREIIAFLRHCRERHAPATILLARSYIEQSERDSDDAPHRLRREALRWFFRAARERGGATPGFGPSRVPASLATTVPPLAASDLGRSEWERALIRAVRERHFQWRTEQTYRQWAARFARFIAPDSPEKAGAAELQAFLSDLAVRLRASPSSQKQALNAIVFLLQEALHRHVGELNFERARRVQRIPTVLTTGECSRLFAQLEGTARLMGELAYGSGLRLMELLRLRVHDIDLERRQLTVRGGKGDKDRVEGPSPHAA